MRPGEVPLTVSIAKWGQKKSLLPGAVKRGWKMSLLPEAVKRSWKMPSLQDSNVPLITLM